MFRFTSIAACAAATLIAVQAGAVRAQNSYPTQTVKIVVPGPAGSTTDLLARTLAERLGKKWNRGTVIAYAKANPGKVTYASGGVGNTSHLSAEQLATRAGIKMLHVPYRGSQPALTDVVNGHVDIFFDTLTTSVPLYRDKQVKLLGVADLQRSSTVPEVPTISESGLSGYRSITWFGMVAPPGTPVALAERINRDTVEIMKTPEMQTFLSRVSLSPAALSPEETRKFFRDESELWTRVIKEAGLELQNVQ